jgi:acetyltransferase-like isoleucine patch superfamily enzyme
MKNVIKKIIFSQPTLQVIRFFSLILGYDQKIFKSKYFVEMNKGWIWLLKSIWFQRVIGFNRFAKYPMHPTCYVSNFKNIHIHMDSINNLMSPGCYYQSPSSNIFIEKNVYIGPNVGIITSNHDISNPCKHASGADVVIKNNCWIGMNSTILPGVILGPNTVVGAGSVVNKSFESGSVVLAGSPAKIIKILVK